MNVPHSKSMATSAERIRLLADATAAGWRVSHSPGGTISIVKGVRPPHGLVLYPSGVAVALEVDCDAQRGIRGYAAIRRYLGLEAHS